MHHRGHRRLLLPILGLMMLVVTAGLVAAQESETEERSRFVRFVERQISTPDRQIRLGGIEGALSSNVRLDSITVADREGVWLRIEDVHLVWSRSALLRRRLEVELIEADRIAILRAPVPAEGPSEPIEEQTFELPEFPLTFNVGELRVPRIEIAPGVVGDQGYVLSLTGSGTLEEGTLDVDVAVERLDGAGQLQLAASFSDDTRVLDLDLLYSEPPQGLVATLLNIEGRPAVTFAIQGTAPLEEFTADITLTAAEEELLSGEVALSGAETGGLRLIAEVGGNLERLVPATYRELVDEGSRLTIDATRAEDGSISIAAAELTSGAASLQVSGELASDGVPTELDIAATLGTAEGAPVNLPVGEGQTTVGSARLTARLGGEEAEGWTAEAEVGSLITPSFSLDRLTIAGSGAAANMADPAARRVTFDLTGSASGLETEAEELASALAGTVDLAATGAWQSGQPLQFDRVRVESGSTVLAFEGQFAETIEGTFSIETPSLAVFSAIANRDLGGSANISGTGSLTPAEGTFSLTLDGLTRDLELGVPTADRLLAGQTTVSGTVARTADGLSFDGFTLENPQVSLQADGQQGGGPEGVTITGRIMDLAEVTDQASGSLALDASVSGPSGAADVSARVSGENLRLQERPFREAVATFDGRWGEEGISGTFDLSGELDGVAVSANAELANGEDGRRLLRGIDANAGETTLGGEIAVLPRGLYEGELTLDSPDLSTVAPLALLEASGALTATITLAAADEGQSVQVEAQADDLTLPETVGGIELDAADISLSIADAFGLPMAAGQVTAEELRVAGVSFPSVDLQAQRGASTTDLDLAMGLAGGELRASASLGEATPGFAVQVEALEIVGPEIRANLIDPLGVTLGSGSLDGINAVLQIGDGRLTLSGDVGPVLALSAEVEEVPLQIINAFQPDLDASGFLAGTARLGGTPEAPIATFDLRGQELTVALLDLVGLDPIALRAEGRFAEDTLTIDAEAELAGRTVSLDGTIGETLDATVGIDRFPLEVVDAVAPELELRGAISAQLHATGTLAEPRATFELQGEEVTLALLQGTGLPALEITVGGRFEDGAAELTNAVIDIGGGEITLQGAIGEMLDVDATVNEIPLSLANPMLPDIELAGAISGSAEVAGPIFAPEAAFGLTGSGITSGKLREAGIPPGQLSLTGSYADGSAVLTQSALEIAGGRLAISGDVWPDLGLDVEIVSLPLSLAAAIQPDLALQGSLSGSAEVTGFVLDPVAAFAIDAQGITSPELREGGITDGSLRARGGYEAGTATLEEATLEAGDGRIRAQGSIGERLDLSAEMTEFPAAAVRVLSPELGLTGMLSGTLSATGSAADPTVDFEIRGSGITGFGSAPDDRP